MTHDWVTSNSINPMPRVIYPKLEITKSDTINIFTKISAISKIKIKIRNHINKRRK